MGPQTRDGRTVHDVNRTPSARVDIGAVELGHDRGILRLLKVPALRALPSSGYVAHHHVVIRAVGLYTGGEVVHAVSVCLRRPGG